MIISIHKKWTFESTGLPPLELLHGQVFVVSDYGLVGQNHGKVIFLSQPGFPDFLGLLVFL